MKKKKRRRKGGKFLTGKNTADGRKKGVPREGREFPNLSRKQGENGKREEALQLIGEKGTGKKRLRPSFL